MTKISDLGERLLEICALLPGQPTADIGFATAIGMAHNLPNWTAMKKGRRVIHTQQLRALLDHMGLKHCSVDVFFLKKAEMIETIQEDLVRFPVPAHPFPHYKASLAEKFRTRLILDQQLDISTHYYSTTLTRIDSIQALDPVDAISVLQNPEHTRVCIVGPSGFGKTAAIRRFVWLAQGAAPVTFVLRLKTYASALLSGTIGIEHVINNCLEGFYADPTEINGLRRELRARRGVFIIDGVDYIRDNFNLRTNVFNILENYFADANAKVIITTRERSDLLGSFQNFEYFRINPIEQKEFEHFLSKTPLSLPQPSAELVRGIHERASPFVMLTASALVKSSRSDNTRLARIGSTYDLLDATLNRLLLRESHTAAGSTDRWKMRHEVRQIRKSILDRLLRNWPGSRLPLRVTRQVLLQHCAAAIHEVDENIVSQFTDLEGAFNYIVPTGICLERSYENFEEEIFVFVHDIIQHFLYVRRLKIALREGNPLPFSKDYYSTEILRLFGESLDSTQIAQLADWIADASMDAMVRKVAASALGFVRAELSEVAREALSRLFRRPMDIGVDGRIAESLRRLGDLTSVPTFISNFEAYRARSHDRADPSRPITFEIEERSELDGPLFSLLEMKLHSAPHSVTRKHALILLLRSHRGPLMKDLSRFCTRELRELVMACERPGGLQEDEEDERVFFRSLLYGVAGLSRFASYTEVPLLSHISTCLHDLACRFDLTPLRNRVHELQSRLQRAVLSEVVDYSGNDNQLMVYLIRHGESFGNSSKTFSGSSHDPELTEIGLKQAILTANRISNHIPNGTDVTIISSPAKRCTQTASQLSKIANLPIEVDHRFAEMNMGEWAGNDRSAIDRRWPNQIQNWISNKWLYAPPGGESLIRVQARASEALFAHMGRFSEVNRKKVLVIFTHFHPIVALDAELGRGGNLRPKNCSINSYFVDAQRWRQGFKNDTIHLGDVEGSAPSYV